MATFLSIGSAIVATVYPYIIPFSITIPESASPESTQVFMLFGVGIMLPIIIFYNLYEARVFSEVGSNLLLGSSSLWWAKRNNQRIRYHR